MTLLHIFIGGLVLVFALSAMDRVYVAIVTFRGTYPKKGCGTMRDVERSTSNDMDWRNDAIASSPSRR